MRQNELGSNDPRASTKRHTHTPTWLGWKMITWVHLMEPRYSQQDAPTAAWAVSAKVKPVSMAISLQHGLLVPIVVTSWSKSTDVGSLVMWQTIVSVCQCVCGNR